MKDNDHNTVDYIIGWLTNMIGDVTKEEFTQLFDKMLERSPSSTGFYILIHKIMTTSELKKAYGKLIED